MRDSALPSEAYITIDDGGYESIFQYNKSNIKEKIILVNAFFSPCDVNRY